jgi:hypothetical protein
LLRAFCGGDPAWMGHVRRRSRSSATVDLAVGEPRALTLAGGRVYAATGLYCDTQPSIGKVISVDTTTKQVSSWEAVPAEEGGGGGIWGWGGSAFSPTLDRLFVVTGNAFEGGRNVGPAFSEAAGFGESIVSLTPALTVAGSSHPASIDQPLDLDFVGSPVVADRPGCGRLVVGMDKNAQLFGWRADDLGHGPIWTVDLEPFDPRNPVLSQLAYDPSSVAGDRRRGRPQPDHANYNLAGADDLALVLS